MIMHNGVKVSMGRFANHKTFANIVPVANKGVHEPQEETVVMEAHRFIPVGGTMMESGTCRALYSMLNRTDRGRNARGSDTRPGGRGSPLFHGEGSPQRRRRLPALAWGGETSS